MKCLYCSRELGLLKSLKGHSFCSEDHRRLYHNNEKDLFLRRVQEWVPRSELPTAKGQKLAPEPKAEAPPESAVHAELESPVYAEPESAVHAELESPVYAEPESPVHAEPESPVYVEPEPLANRAGEEAWEAYKRSVAEELEALTSEADELLSSGNNDASAKAYIPERASTFAPFFSPDLPEAGAPLADETLIIPIRQREEDDVLPAVLQGAVNEAQNEAATSGLSGCPTLPLKELEPNRGGQSTHSNWLFGAVDFGYEVEKELRQAPSFGGVSVSRPFATDAAVACQPASGGGQNLNGGPRSLYFADYQRASKAPGDVTALRPISCQTLLAGNTQPGYDAAFGIPWEQPAGANNRPGPLSTTICEAVSDLDQDRFELRFPERLLGSVEGDLGTIASRTQVAVERAPNPKLPLNGAAAVVDEFTAPPVSALSEAIEMTHDGANQLLDELPAALAPQPVDYGNGAGARPDSPTVLNPALADSEMAVPPTAPANGTNYIADRAPEPEQVTANSRETLPREAREPGTGGGESSHLEHMNHLEPEVQRIPSSLLVQEFMVQDTACAEGPQNQVPRVQTLDAGGSAPACISDWLTADRLQPPYPGFLLLSRTELSGLRCGAPLGFDESPALAATFAWHGGPVSRPRLARPAITSASTGPVGAPRMKLGMGLISTPRGLVQFKQIVNAGRSITCASPRHIQREHPASYGGDLPGCLKLKRPFGALGSEPRASFPGQVSRPMFRCFSEGVPAGPALGAPAR